MYLLYVNDYDELGFSESEARISFHGETTVKMEVEDGNNEDRCMLSNFAQRNVKYRQVCKQYTQHDKH